MSTVLDKFFYGSMGKPQDIQFSLAAANAMNDSGSAQFDPYMNKFGLGANVGGNFGGTPGLLNGPQGMLGGFSTLAGFGSNLMNMYGGWKQAQLAQDMWDTQKNYLSMNSWNQGVLADERRAKQRARRNSMSGKPIDWSYLDNPEKLRRTV